MRYVIELADGSRYISSSLAAKAQVIRRLATEGRLELIIHEFQWDMSYQTLTEARKERKADLIDYADAETLQRHNLPGPGYRWGAEKRAREAGYPAQLPYSERKAIRTRLQRELQKAAERKKARQDAATTARAKVEERVKEINPDIKCYWPEVD